jgi:hypothetical protein
MSRLFRNIDAGEIQRIGHAAETQRNIGAALRNVAGGRMGLRVSGASERDP